MLSIITFLLISFQPIVLSQVLPPVLINFQQLPLPPPASGPYSIAFPLLGAVLRRFFTGIADGRIVRYDGTNFVDFAITSPNRSKALCDGTNDTGLGPTCGRPLGLGLHLATNELFVTDRYRGLLRVPPSGGLAVQLATSAEGVPFGTLSDLEVDPISREVFFTDSASRLSISQLIEGGGGPAPVPGRLLRYDPNTGQVNVLLNGLEGPTGVAQSLDRTYLLISETPANRIRRFWLRGPRAFTSEIVVIFQGRPVNIQRNIINFVVAVNIIQRPTPTGPVQFTPTAVTITGNGIIMQNLDLSRFYGNTTITEYHQAGIRAFIGSLRATFVGQAN